MSAQPEQKYAMTRVQAGDYLLPSNDGKTLWRLSTYDEDGSAYWVDRSSGKETKVVGKFWSAWRFNGTIDEAESLLHSADPELLLEWDRWIESATALSTRKEALEYALTAAVPA